MKISSLPQLGKNMKILIVTAGYSIFDAKGQLNGFLAYLTEKNLSAKGYHVKYSDVRKPFACRSPACTPDSGGRTMGYM